MKKQRMSRENEEKRNLGQLCEKEMIVMMVAIVEE